MMRIEMLSTVKHDTPQGYLFTEGEVRTVDDKVGRLFCAQGWARDLDGKIPTGERSTGNAQLAVDDVTAASTAEIK